MNKIKSIFYILFLTAICCINIIVAKGYGWDESSRASFQEINGIKVEASFNYDTKKSKPNCRSIDEDTEWPKVAIYLNKYCISVTRYDSTGQYERISPVDETSCDQNATKGCNMLVDKDNNYCGKKNNLCGWVPTKIVNGNQCKVFASGCSLELESEGKDINDAGGLDGYLNKVQFSSTGEYYNYKNSTAKYVYCSRYIANCYNRADSCKATCEHNYQYSSLPEKAKDYVYEDCMKGCDEKDSCPYWQHRNSEGLCVDNATGTPGAPRRRICTGKDYTAEAYQISKLDCEVPFEYSAEAAQCNTAETFHKGHASSYVHIKTDLIIKRSGSTYQPSWYQGTCDGKDVEVYCIDPGKHYFQSRTITSSTSVSKEISTKFDKGYLKIYQEALRLYKGRYDAYLSKTSNGLNATPAVNNDLNPTLLDKVGKEEKINNLSYDILSDEEKYTALHVAFRMFTWTEGNTPDISGINSNIASAFNGTGNYLKDNVSYVYPGEANYFTVKDAVATPGLTTTPGYADGIRLFQYAIENSDDVWEHQLKFTAMSTNSAKTEYNVVLSGLNSIRESEFSDKFIKNITCTNCTVLSGLPGPDANILDVVSGDSIDFKIKINDISQKVVFNVNYYDRRDHKNIIISTNDEKREWQRLLLVGVEPREFSYQQELEISPNVCSIYGNHYYDSNGKSTDLEGYLLDCCAAMENNTELKTQFCATVRGTVNEYMCNDEWIKNGCRYSCNPNNTTDKCLDTELGDNKVIKISDFTDKVSIGMANSIDSVKDYCLACASNNETDLADNSYLQQTVTSPYSSKKLCSIYCIEEYKFTVPTHLTTQGSLKYGRYLNMNATGETKRICFTNPKTRINREGLVQDASSLKSEIDTLIKEVNDLIVAKNNCNSSTVTVTNTGNYCTKPAEYSYSCKTDDGDPDSDHKCTPKGGGDKYDATRVKTYDGCSSSRAKKNYSYSYTVNGVPDSKTCNEGCSDCSISPECSVDNVCGQVNTLLINTQSVLQSKIQTYNDLFDAYNSCFDLSRFGSGNCINGSNGPYIDFDYEESYYMNLLKNDNKLVGDWYTKNSHHEYYNNDNAAGSICGFNDANTADFDTSNYIVNGTVVTYPSYTYNGSTATSTPGAKVVKEIKYTYYEEYKWADLKPKATWYTRVGTGEATLDDKTPNIKELGNKLPISRECSPSHGKYHYGLTIRNIGLYNGYSGTSCRLGRLNTVVSKIKDTGSISNNTDYACDYKVSQKSCEGCETTYFFRSISLDDVFPKQIVDNDQNTYGEQIKNPNPSRNVVNVWNEDFGIAARKQIESDGQHTYDNDKKVYSYRLTPAGMRAIRQYNRENDRTYGDFELDCDSKGNKCISRFLSDIAQQTERYRNNVIDLMPERAHISSFNQYAATVRFKIYDQNLSANHGWKFETRGE